MHVQLVRIGNSRGVRLPQKVLSLYGIKDGDRFIIEERQAGILLKPDYGESEKIGWDSAYAEMAAEAAEGDEWAAWDIASGDGLTD
jgi:antitoxin component of MazEF toxin-antitoxin module